MEGARVGKASSHLHQEAFGSAKVEHLVPVRIWAVP